LGIRQFGGDTIDVCAHSTLRAAVDLGYECLLLADCCGAVNGGLHRCAIESVKAENGVFGTVTNSRTFIRPIVGDDGESRKPAERGLPAMARATRTRRHATGQGRRG
jgi:hypothetical protein